MSTNKRIRGRELQAIRGRHYRRDPLCVRCRELGIVKLWTQLDHIIPVEDGGPDTDENRQGLCVEHHREKTAKDQGYRLKPVIGLDGYPLTE